MEKRFYWLKLKDNFFQEDAIEWLEEQQNGKEYVLFYLKLCLKSLRNNGVLVRKVGDILIPYDVAKLAEITKTNPDTVVVAMEILKKIGLVDVYQNGEIYMKCLSDLVGSESASREAVKKREQRKKLKEANMGDVLSPDCPTDCPTEYRDKSIEIRDKSIDIEIDKEKEKDIRKSNRFAPPSVDDVRAYCNERHNNVDPERFVDYYESNGWKVGKNKMKDWKATVRSWEHNDYSNNKKQNGSIIHEVPMPAYCAEKDNYTKPSDEPPWKGVERQYNADKMMLIDGMISGDEFRSREANLKAMYKDLTGKELE